MINPFLEKIGIIFNTLLQVSLSEVFKAYFKSAETIESSKFFFNVASDVGVVEETPSSSTILRLSAVTSFEFEFEADVAWRATSPLMPATPRDMIEKII